MKTCPYCAEEIKDAAIRCRWCLTWLVDDAPAGAEGPRPATAMSDPDDGTPSTGGVTPAATTTAGGPSDSTPESEPTPASAEAVATSPGSTASEPTPAQPRAEPKIEFTHTGARYLLGYGADFFGIWDRNTPQQPIERFPRNDQGWASAWARYAQIETNWMDLRTGQKSG